MSKFIDLTGKRFGKLIVLKRIEDYVFNSGRKERQWLCKCDCGNEINVIGTNLKRGNTKSCGCYRIDVTKELHTKHNLSNSKFMNTLKGMKSRCYNPKDKRYNNYGGRGITICDEWLCEDGLINFYNWLINNRYAENLTIDRIDSNKGYYPDNCRWVDMKTQQNNRTNNRLITYNNETMTLAMWAEKLGLNYKILANRIYSYGWSIEKAFNTPIRNISKKSINNIAIK